MSRDYTTEEIQIDPVPLSGAGVDVLAELDSLRSQEVAELQKAADREVFAGIMLSEKAKRNE